MTVSRISLGGGSTFDGEPPRDPRAAINAADDETYRHPQTRGPIHPRRASLLLIGEETAGAALRENAPLVIGRAPPSDLVLADRSLSRVHAKVTWREDELIAEDLGSTNGITVDGQRVETAVIKPESDIRLGGVRLVVHVSTFVASDHRATDRFAEHVEAEVRRARTFGRSLAILAARRAGDAEAWERELAACLRPVDAITMASHDVALVALAEVERGDLPAWAARLRASVPDAELRLGAALYPEHGDDAAALIQAALDALSGASASGVRCASTPRPVGTAAPSVVVESPPMKALYDLIPRVARTRMPVLVLGETGAGKELVARGIHDASPRAGGPFRAINCATVPATLTESALFGHEKGAFTGATARAKGLFEQADGGTVFLDEVGELALPAQAALLRVLETGRITRVGGGDELDVDVRIVAATHRDLASMARDGSFRADLLYRLDAMALEVPPLRERVEDIAPLARAFVQRAAEQWQTCALALEPAVLDAFCAYAWPGNVRQLRNVVDRAAAIAVGPQITLLDLPRDVANAVGHAPTETEPSSTQPSPVGRSLTERVSAFEREILRETLEQTRGNQSRAAELLDVPRRTLAHKVKRHGLA